MQDCILCGQPDADWQGRFRPRPQKRQRRGYRWQTFYALCRKCHGPGFRPDREVIAAVENVLALRGKPPAAVAQ